MARRHNANDYGAPAARSNKLHRPLLLANNVLHFISTLIVMSIAAYFIHKFKKNTHLVYWVTIVRVSPSPASHLISSKSTLTQLIRTRQGAIDVLLYLPAL